MHIGYADHPKIGEQTESELDEGQDEGLLSYWARTSTSKK